jgi:YD repeat-containing protein
MSEPPSDLDPVGKLAEAFLARCRRGERPSVTEYTQQYPELAEQIRDLFPALAMIEELGSAGGPAPLADPAATRRDVPRQLGEYRLLREVGRGGMGIVYEAVQESLGRHVALKVFPEHGLLTATHLERFRREAKAVAQLHHPNIVPVFGVGESAGVHYFAMQFIVGQGLDVIVRELKQLRGENGLTPPDPSGPSADPSMAQGLLSGRWPSTSTPPDTQTWTPDSAAPASDTRVPTPAIPDSMPETTGPSDAEYFRSVARMGLQVAEALAHAHQQGILHRDIKPSNLLLDAHGTVWVTDFGLAKAEGAEDLTTTGDIVGTLRYMAPERFSGWSDPRSDVYGLGITLYELMTLRPAFQDSNRPRLIERVLHDAPPRPRSLDPHIPRDLETIILKAIAKEPGDRYSSAAALAEDLRCFLAYRAIQARQATPLEQGWRWCRRNPAVAALAATLGLILLGSVVALTGLYVKANGQRQRAEEAEDNWRTAAAEARAGEAKSRQSEAQANAVLKFFQERVLKAARPKGQEGGLGRGATIQAALDQAEPGIAETFADQPLAEAAIRQTLGLTYWFMGENSQAIQQLGRALALRRAALAPDHPDILNSMAHLAQAYQAAGNITEVLRLHKEIFELRKARFGPNDSETLWTMNRLAMTLLTAGRPEEALPLFEEGLKRAQTALGPVHNDTLIYMDNLAIGYRYLGRLAESLQLFEQALKLEQANLEPNHPDTLATMNNLAVTYHEAGRLTEALDLLEETLNLRKTRLGPDHPDTLNSMNLLAAVYRDVGRVGEALPLAEKAAQLMKQKEGPDHPYTLMFMCNLATTYREAGRLAEAKALYEDTLRLQKAKLGPNHLLRLRAMNDLGVCLVKMKRYEEAVADLRECLALRAQKNPGDWWVFQTKSQLGQALTGLKSYAEAEALLREAHQGLVARKDKIPGRYACCTGEAAQALANLYEAWDQKEQAALWRQKATRMNPQNP